MKERKEEIKKVGQDFSRFKDQRVTIFLKNKFRYDGIIKEVTLNQFLLFYDLKEEITIMIPLDLISIVEFVGGNDYGSR